jgi:signal transduction histidine kinase/CHASE3 domain sensor protein
MKRSNPKLVKFVLICGIIILVSLSVLSNLRIKKLIDTSEAVNHTHRIKIELEDAYSTLADLESSQRGYIITRDSVFIRSYWQDSVELRMLLNRLDSLFADNPSQVANVKKLHTLIENRRNYIEHVLSEASHQRIKTDEMLIGRALMDDVHRQMDIMKNEEDRLLNIRTLRWLKESYLNPILITAVSLISIIVLLLAYFKIMRDLKFSNKLSLDLEEGNKRLADLNSELQLNQERFFKIFENNPVALSFGEIGTNKIIYANKLFYKYFGYSPEEVIGHTSEELQLVSPEENARLLPIIMSNLGETRSVEELQNLPIEEMEQLLIKLRERMFKNGFEVKYTRKNGETFYALVYYELIELGKKRYALTSYQDVTEQKKIQQQVERQNEELTRMNKELEEFNYISSHDLQEPLRKIQTFASRIEEIEAGKLSEKGKEIFLRIQNSANKMQMLIDDLLSYSRMSNSERKFERTDLRKIIEEVKDELKDEIMQKQAVVEIEGDCELDVIPFQFRQLVYNLVSNSLKFTDEFRKPVIKVSCNMEPGNPQFVKNPEKTYCHIRIADNGIGFEPEYSNKIFELFNRLHRKGKYKGTGIGLAIVKKIVENHNGFISATGDPGKGATFDIYIPELR